MGVLDDVSVVELSIAIAAPSCGRALAFHGAEVVKLESRTNPDVARLFGSAWARDLDPDVYMDTSPYLAEMSANKRSVGLDLKHSDGRGAALGLLAHADVFLTNYSTPAVRSLGLGCEDVVAVNPDIIYVALPGFGSDATQPYYGFLAWGPNQAPLVGLDALTGYPDQEPAGIATIAPPDYFAGLHALAAVLTGLEHRDRTGEGSCIDIAQFETTVSSLGPFLLDHALSGATPERSGNRLAWLAPQGCYPCRGEDAWVAITISDDDQWSALASVVSGDLDEPRFSTLAGRLAHHDELDVRISAWTANRTAAEVASYLQEVGVPAYEVLDNIGVLHDPQVRDRDWFESVPSARFPDGDVFSGHPIRLTDTPGAWWRAGPSLGEDTAHVLTGLGAFTSADVDGFSRVGAVFSAAEPDQTLRRPYIDYVDILGVRQTAT
jgi:benzylsuccinate CoA-transferase BbsF subunit